MSVTAAGPQGRAGIRVLLVLEENHFCLIFIPEGKKSSAAVLGFYDMM